MLPALRNVGRGVAGAGSVASDVTQLPGLGLAVGALDGIVSRAENVAVAKKDGQWLADACRQYKHEIESNANRVDDEFRIALDELLPTLERVLSLVEANTGKSAWKRYINYNKTAESLRKAKSMLESALVSFQHKTMIRVNVRLHESMMMDTHRHDELLTYLREILFNTDELSRIPPDELPNFMREGQEMLRGWRESSRSSTGDDAMMTDTPQSMSPVREGSIGADRSIRPRSRSRGISPFGTPSASIPPAAYASHGLPSSPPSDRQTYSRHLTATPPLSPTQTHYTASQSTAPSFPSPQVHHPSPQYPPNGMPSNAGYRRHTSWGSAATLSPGFGLPDSQPMASTPSPEPGEVHRVRFANQDYSQLERGLSQLARRGIPPSVKIMNGEVERDGGLPVAGGVYSDIWIGWWLGIQGEGYKVALKALRMVKVSKKIEDRFVQEINVWSRLKHSNILPFYGVVTNIGQHVNMVSPWQEEGNVLKYVETHPGCSRLNLMFGASKGLAYLHEMMVVHGNMKCTNILCSAQGTPLICDFGMSKVIEDVTETIASATLTTSGSARWLAPELIEGVITSPSTQTDTYSFGMTMLECITLKHPYAHCRRDAMVIHEIVSEKRHPPRPAPEAGEVSDEWWNIITSCWVDPRERPTMRQVVDQLEKLMAPDMSMDLK